jgi:hypothetical protein
MTVDVVICGYAPFASEGQKGGRVAKAKTQAATVGVAEHGNSAVLVTVAGRELLDRRRIDLTTGLSTHPYHHEGAWAVGRYLDSPWARPIPLADAVALIERVHEAAAAGARAGLAALAGDLSLAVERIAIRVCAPLPPTIEERLADNRAQSAADSILYRQALAAAAVERGWAVHWYDRERVFATAAAACETDIEALLRAMGRAVGPPWQAKQKLAAAAALAAAAEREPGRKRSKSR